MAAMKMNLIMSMSGGISVVLLWLVVCCYFNEQLCGGELINMCCFLFEDLLFDILILLGSGGYAE